MLNWMLIFPGFLDWLVFFGLGSCTTCRFFFGSLDFVGFSGSGFVSFADTNIYNSTLNRKLFRLIYVSARRKKDLPDEWI